MRELTDQNFQAATAQGLWMVHFWSPTCAPCRVIEPMFLRLEETYAPDLQFGAVNGKVELETGLSQQIQGYPTILTYKDGQPLGMLFGVRPFRTYQETADALRQLRVVS